MTDTRKTLAEQLTALMAYRAAPDHAPEPLQSNWTTVPANDNADPTEVVDFSFERKLLVTPSVEEIMRQVSIGPVTRNDEAQVVAIGRLRFSDGTQTEKAYTAGPDGSLIQYDRRMPTGSMLGTREKVESALGGKGYNHRDEANSNSFFASSLGTDRPRYIKRSARRNGPSITPDESRALIADAIANTKVMPAVTVCPPGLPCGAPRVCESFVGMQPAAAGASGSIAWQDIGQTIENSKIWSKVKAALRAKDSAALDAAMSAQTFADIGEAVGQAPEYARRKGGRRALLAANDNLAAAIKKFVA